jgi:hypothetical protein
MVSLDFMFCKETVYFIFVMEDAIVSSQPAIIGELRGDC